MSKLLVIYGLNHPLLIKFEGLLRELIVKPREETMPLPESTLLPSSKIICKIKLVNAVKIAHDLNFASVN